MEKINTNKTNEYIYLSSNPNESVSLSLGEIQLTTVMDTEENKLLKELKLKELKISKAKEKKLFKSKFNFNPLTEDEIEIVQEKLSEEEEEISPRKPKVN